MTNAAMSRENVRRLELVVDAGAALTRLAQWLIANRHEDDECVVAMTGSVVQDVADRLKVLEAQPARRGWDWPDRMGQLCGLAVVMTLAAETDIEKGVALLAGATMAGVPAHRLLKAMRAECEAVGAEVEAWAKRIQEAVDG